MTTMSGLPQAVAVLDLALGGVHAEMADIPFDWFGAAKPAPAAAPVREPVRSPSRIEPMPVMTVGQQAPREPLMPAASVQMPSAAASLMAPPKPEPVRMAPVEIPGEIWFEGEAGGVVMVVQGAMPDGPSQSLARAMLTALGMADAVLGWVGYSGKADAAEMRKTMADLTPQRVLVLGQGPLGILLGRNLGVEGWHAAGGQSIPDWQGGAVGVTYPLELLRKQPLFKKLAWQHLLAWQTSETSGQ